jgi:hypothetical protein
VKEVDLGPLGLDRGGHILLRLALEEAEVARVVGSHPDLDLHLSAWCRAQGHVREGGLVRRGAAASGRWRGAVQAGAPDRLVDHPPGDWSFAARGAWVEAGAPPVDFALDRKDEVWAEAAPRLYAQAASAQWDPAADIPWHLRPAHHPRIEEAVVSIMAYLIENEEAALVVPARFLGRIHPHFREVQQALAIQVADEARHIDVFTRRAHLLGPMRALSTVGGRRSLQTLLEEPDFAVATFLLSVLGEGTFLSLLGFLERHAPDPLTRRIAQLARADEGRHVAFAMSHLEHRVLADPGMRAKLAMAVDRRHQALASTAGLNEEVFDSLVLLAAGGVEPEAIAAGWDRVQGLEAEMHEGRQARLARLGFSAGEADRLSSLHTRNFM